MGNKPIGGVVSVSNLDLDTFWTYIDNNGLNLDMWLLVEKYKKENGGRQPGEEWYEGIVSDDPDYIVGYKYVDAPKEPHGMYIVDEDAEFTAYISTIGGAYTAQVVHSTHTTRVRSMCSPCCPGHADIDSGAEEDGILCYTLPPRFFPSSS